MKTEDRDFQAAHEIGKIYYSFLDSRLLGDFFLESTSGLIKAREARLYLAGQNDRLWLVSGNHQSGKSVLPSEEEIQASFESGKPEKRPHELRIPLIVRNASIGIACFGRGPKGPAFSEKDFSLATDLAYQAAGALKNLTLYEQNLKMERVAAIGQTAGILMHEIKNLLQLIHFAEQYLRMGLEKNNPKNVERGLTGLRKSLKDMDGFIFETLSLTKDYSVVPEKVSLRKLLGELKEDLKQKSDIKHVTLDFEAEPSLGEVDADGRPLFRVLLNLVKNSLEASNKKDGFIRIRARSVDADRYEILVEDNGEGMDEQAKAKLFQAFFTTKGGKGTGLGMLTVDRTVKAHGGEIRFESEKNKGTKFFLTLPKRIS